MIIVVYYINLSWNKCILKIYHVGWLIVQDWSFKFHEVYNGVYGEFNLLLLRYIISLILLFFLLVRRYFIFFACGSTWTRTCIRFFEKHLVRHVRKDGWEVFKHHGNEFDAYADVKYLWIWLILWPHQTRSKHHRYIVVCHLVQLLKMNHLREKT